MKDYNKNGICDNCGNSLVFNQPFCRHCLQELGKYPLNKVSEARANYELGIISGLPEADQERFSSYQKQLETVVYMKQTAHL